MKYIKKFENNETPIFFPKYIIENSGLAYFNDGFMGFSIQDFSKKSKYYTYYFKFDMEMFGDYRIGINKLITFLKSINAKNIREYNETDNIEVAFDIECDRADELSELYMNINKYNI